jgi:hypothetical protein
MPKLPTLTTASLTGAELVYVDQSNTDRKTTTAAIAALATVATSLNGATIYALTGG